MARAGRPVQASMRRRADQRRVGALPQATSSIRVIAAGSVLEAGQLLDDDPVVAVRPVR